jgi:MFS family permease
MYAIDWAALLGRKRKGAGGWIPAVSQTVWALGFTSMFTDISSEMVASILPMYLVVQLGLQPFAFGVVDAVYQGAAALVRVIAGVVSDRGQRYKGVATLGYGLSALCRIALLVAGSTWGVIVGIVAVDRIGKGVRTAPRDALISLRTPEADLGTAFGVHRGMDAAGAMFGPLLAFVLLAALPGRFDVLFATSFVVAVIGVAIIVLFVAPVTGEASHASSPLKARSTDLLRAPRFRAILVAGFVLGLPTVSDAFIFLSLQQRLSIGTMTFPLLYVGTSLFTALFSVPFGRLADVLGRTTVLLGGYGLLAVAYVTLVMPQASIPLAIVTLGLLGAYYAATDGVLTAMAAAVLPPGTSGSGLAYLATSTNVARIVASVLFGLLWTASGLASATAYYLAALILAIVMSAILLRRSEAAA